ncbi:MAG: hypothetical protein ABL889_16995 [Terricaulis sp.]
MPSFTVQWEIEVDAESPQAAAKAVFDEHFAFGGSGRFTVTDEETGEPFEVNALEEEDDE